MGFPFYGGIHINELNFCEGGWDFHFVVGFPPTSWISIYYVRWVFHLHAGGLKSSAREEIKKAKHAHLTTGNLSHGGPVDEVVYALDIHRSDGVQVPQHIQGFHVVVAFHDRNERPPPAAR